MKVCIYTRVSTSNQTTENQRHDLLKVAAARGWNVVAQLSDEGVSGKHGRSKRPALDKMLKEAVRGKFDLIAVWSVDRLGRSLQNLVETVNELHAVGVDLYIHQSAIDTSTPAGKLSFQIFGALAEFERSMITDRVLAGMETAKRNGVKIGRPSNLTETVKASIIALRAQNHPIRKIASELKVGTQTVYTVLREAA